MKLNGALLKLQKQHFETRCLTTDLIGPPVWSWGLFQDTG